MCVVVGRVVVSKLDRRRDMYRSLQLADFDSLQCRAILCLVCVSLHPPPPPAPTGAHRRPPPLTAAAARPQQRGAAAEQEKWPATSHR